MAEPTTEERRQHDLAYALLHKASRDLAAIGVPRAVIRWGFVAVGAGAIDDELIRETFAKAIDDGLAGRDPAPPFGRVFPLDPADN